MSVDFFEKAFDQIDWDFVDHMVEYFKFRTDIAEWREKLQHRLCFSCNCKQVVNK